MYIYIYIYISGEGTMHQRYGLAKGEARTDRRSAQRSRTQHQGSPRYFINLDKTCHKGLFFDTDFELLLRGKPSTFPMSPST